jgi:hypothetical protein
VSIATFIAEEKPWWSVLRLSRILVAAVLNQQLSERRGADEGVEVPFRPHRREWRVDGFML